MNTISLEELSKVNPYGTERVTVYVYDNVPGPGVEYRLLNIAALGLEKTGRPERIMGWPTDYWCCYVDERGEDWWIGCDVVGDLVTPYSRTPKVSSDRIDRIIDRIKPQIGGFDVNEDEKWCQIKAEINDWFENGDDSYPQTDDEIIADINDLWGEALDQIGNGR